MFERHRPSSEDPFLFLASAVLEGHGDWDISRDPMSPFLDKEIAVFKSGGSYVEGN